MQPTQLRITNKNKDNFLELRKGVSESLHVLDELQKKIDDENKKLIQKQDQYAEQLLQVDEEISDILHFIAFETVNTCKWPRIYKLLSSKVQERAEIERQKRLLDSTLSGIEQGKPISEIVNESDNRDDANYAYKTDICETIRSF